MSLTNETKNANTDRRALSSWLKIACVVGCGFAGHYIYDKWKRYYYNYPPGPTGIPLFGSFFSILSNDDMYNFLNYLNIRDNDNISMFYMAGETWIMVHNESIVKKYFKKQEFSNRPNSCIWATKIFENITFSEAKQRRSIMIQSLLSQAQKSSKMYQLIGSTCIETDMFNKIDHCIDNNKIWTIDNEVKFVTFSAIHGAMLGESIDINDKLFLKFIKLCDYCFDKLLYAEMIDSLPDIPNKIISYNYKNFLLSKCLQFKEKQIESINIIKHWVDKKIETINDEIDNNTNHNCQNKDKSDYIKQLLLASKNTKGSNINLQTIYSDIWVAFIAGYYNSAVSIKTGILYLTKYPKLQELIYNQFIEKKLNLKKNKGNVKLFQQCVYFKAFIFETLRLHPTIDTGGNRIISKNNCRIEYFDEKTQSMQYYNIPKGSLVFANLHALNHDSKKFQNDNGTIHKFDINNWLIHSNNIDTKNINHKQLQPSVRFNDKQTLHTFGNGYRDCVGQTLTKNELYLVLGLLILNYKFFAMLPCPNATTSEEQVPLFFRSSNDAITQDFFESEIGVFCQKRQVD